MEHWLSCSPVSIGSAFYTHICAFLTTIDYNSRNLWLLHFSKPREPAPAALPLPSILLHAVWMPCCVRVRTNVEYVQLSAERRSRGFSGLHLYLRSWTTIFCSWSKLDQTIYKILKFLIFCVFSADQFHHRHQRSVQVMTLARNDKPVKPHLAPPISRQPDACSPLHERPAAARAAEAKTASSDAPSIWSICHRPSAR